MGIMTTRLREELPPVYHHDGKPFSKVPVLVKFTETDGPRVWWAAEFDPTTETFYGLLNDGTGIEFAYFSAAHLEEVGVETEERFYCGRTVADLMEAA